MALISARPFDASIRKLMPALLGLVLLTVTQGVSAAMFSLVSARDIETIQSSVPSDRYVSRVFGLAEQVTPILSLCRRAASWEEVLTLSSRTHTQMAAEQFEANRAYTLPEWIDIGPVGIRNRALSGGQIGKVNHDAPAEQELAAANRLKAASNEQGGNGDACVNGSEEPTHCWEELQRVWIRIVVVAASVVLAALAYSLLRLRSSKREIHLLNTSLELRVQERTAEFRQQTRYMRTLFDTLPVWVWLKDTKGRYLSANQPYADAHGQSLETIIGRSDHDLWPLERAELVRNDELEVMTTGERKIVERKELLPGAIEHTWMQTYHVPVLDEDGTILGTVGVTRDISDVRRSLRLGASRARVFERLAKGGQIDEVLSQVAAYVEISAPSLRCSIMERKDTDSFEQIGVENGNWIEPIRDSAGAFLGNIVVSGVTPDSLSDAQRELIGNAMHLAAIAIERKRTEEQLKHQAAYDALTGLPNRRMFADRLNEEIARASRCGGTVTVMFIDLDHFKEVNDTLGHHIGDALLVEVGQRIRQLVRESDVVARLGGDEFVIILPDCGQQGQLERIGQIILEAIGRPLELNEHTVYVSASIGISNYPTDADSMDQLIIYADRAMYAAKEEGRNGYRFFTPPMHQQAKSRMLLANDLRLALASEQLEVWLQPIVDLVSSQVTKAEALLRWKHPVHGMVPPDVFIPIAEETGMIMEIGDWVFRQAATVAKQWLELRSGAMCQVSVNVSPLQFRHGGMIDRWMDILQQLNLPTHCMVAEITEGLLLSDRVGIVDTLARLRQAGVGLALDDFGTGYSAMGYLKKFNIDYLKIDRSFVRDLTTDTSDRAIAEAIIVMARKLKIKTIAEGVETAEQRNMLASVGCDFVQGYWYAKPMPAAEFFTEQVGKQFNAPPTAIRAQS